MGIGIERQNPSRIEAFSGQWVNLIHSQEGFNDASHAMITYANIHKAVLMPIVGTWCNYTKPS